MECERFLERLTLVAARSYGAEAVLRASQWTPQRGQERSPSASTRAGDDESEAQGAESSVDFGE